MGNIIHNMAQFIYLFVKYQWVWNYIKVEHNLRAFTPGLIKQKIILQHKKVTLSTLRYHFIIHPFTQKEKKIIKKLSRITQLFQVASLFSLLGLHNHYITSRNHHLGFSSTFLYVTKEVQYKNYDQHSRSLEYIQFEVGLNGKIKTQFQWVLGSHIYNCTLSFILLYKISIDYLKLHQTPASHHTYIVK